MAGAEAKNHDYHLVNPSPWPFIGSVSAFHSRHRRDQLDAQRFLGRPVTILGFLGVLYTMFMWWRDVIIEGKKGDHTAVVQLHLRYGMLLFIASEVMFFVAWFWAFFDASLFPAMRSSSRARPRPAACGRPRTWRCLIPGTCRSSTR